MEPGSNRVALRTSLCYKGIASETNVIVEQKPYRLPWSGAVVLTEGGLYDANGDVACTTCKVIPTFRVAIIIPILMIPLDRRQEGQA